MHESSIAQGILRVVLEALQSPARRVCAIHVVVGALTGVEEQSLSLWLEELSQGTAAQDAKLVMRRLPAQLACRACGYTGPYDGSDVVPPLCPTCGKLVRLSGGQELFVESVEIEE